MLSALLLPPPATSAPPLRPSGTTIYPSPSPTTFSTSSACSSFTTLPRLPRRSLASVHSSSHLSNPLLFSLPLSRPPVTTTKRGPQPPSATPSSAPLPPSPGLWDNLKAAVAGIPTPVLIAILAVAVIYAASRVFAPPQPAQRERTRVETPPPPPPIQLGEITEDELRQYDGTDPSKPLLMAIKGQIYDVSQGRLFYGPGGPYALFAGKDASRALAKMSFEEKDLNGDISDLGPFELGALQDWEYKFTSKYVTVGTIKNPEAPVIGDTVSASGVVGSNGSLNVSDVTETNKAAVSPDDVVLEGSSVPSNDVQIKEVGGEENSAESIKN